MNKNLFIQFIKKTLFLILVLSFILIGCNSSNNLEELKNNETFTLIFSQDELKEIAIILDFFERKICNSVGESSKIKCYDKFLAEKHAQISNAEPFPIFPIDDQIEMYNTLSDSVYQLFWTSEIRVYKLSSDTIKTNNIMLHGKFNDFLNALSQEDILVKRYTERLDLIGDVYALIGPMTYSENKFNIEDIRIRFFIAIHYLSVNSLMNSTELYETLDTNFINDYTPVRKEPPRTID